MSIAFKLVSWAFNACTLGMDIIQNKKTREMENRIKNMEQRFQNMEKHINSLNQENQRLKEREQVIQEALKGAEENVGRS